MITIKNSEFPSNLIEDLVDVQPMNSIQIKNDENTPSIKHYLMKDFVEHSTGPTDQLSAVKKEGNIDAYEHLGGVCKLINDKFQLFSPWMLFIKVIKDQNVDRISYIQKALPNLVLLHHLHEDHLAISSSWFKKEVLMSEEKNANIFGSEEETAEVWTQLDSVYNSPFIPASGLSQITTRGYETEVHEIMYNIKLVEVYGWGFIITNNKEERYIAIRSKFILKNYKNKVDYSSSEVWHKLSMSLSNINQSFVLPKHVECIDFLMAKWVNYNLNDKDRMNSMDKYLFRENFEHVSVGQKDYKYLDL